MLVALSCPGGETNATLSRRSHTPEGEIIMKSGNIGKGIAFASLWFYAATISVGQGFFQGVVIALGTFAVSAFVVFLFDSGPDKKTE